MIFTSITPTAFAHLLYGALISLEISAFALLIGALGGTALALALVYGNRAVRIACHAYVTIFRGTPMLVQIIAVFYILPFVGIHLCPLWASIATIGLNSAAYISQIVRAGIMAVHKGQIEAAQTLGFSTVQTIRFIVLPQAFYTVLPALSNEFVTLLKDSSLASVVGVCELTHEGSILMNRTYDALSTYAAVGLIYLCMTSCLSLILYFVEKKVCHAQH